MTHDPFAPQEMSPEKTVAMTRRIVARTRGTQRKLRPQVALVARALHGAGSDIDGSFSQEELTSPLPLKAAKVVEMLQATFADDAALAARLEAKVTSFREAEETLASAEAGIGGGSPLPDEQLQALKAAAIALSRFHEGMQNDPLLAQVFPPPTLLQAD